MTMQQTAETQLQQVVSMLARRCKLILAMGLLGATLAGVVGLLMPPEYTAKAQILIDPQQISLAGVRTGSALPVNDLAIETQVAMLLSRNHLRHVHESLLVEPELQVADDGLNRSWSEAVAIPGVDELEVSLNAYQERQSRVVAITFTWTDPQMAAAIANQVARLHVATRVDLKKAEKVSASFDQELADLEYQLSLAKADLEARQTQLTALRELRRGSGRRNEFIAALDSPVLSELRQDEIALLSSQGRPSAASATAQAPAPAKLQELREQIDREAERAMSQLANETQIASAQVLSLQQRVEAVRGARRQARGLEVRRPPPPQPKAVAGDDPYVSLLRRQQREMHAQPEISPGMHILTVAEEPSSPSTPNPILFVFPAFIAFAIAGGMLATVLEVLDRGLRTARDIEAALGIGCIGLVPPLCKAWRKHVYKSFLQNPFDPYTEAIRSVVTSALQLSGPPPQPKVFLITSNVPGEGKTKLSVSFASFAASLQRRVVLVDLAFRQRAIPGDVKKKSAWEERVDVLQGGPWRQAIQHMQDLAIDYLPLQTYSADPVTLLSGSKISDLLGQLRESYDYVVIHGDPLLSAASTRLLVPMVDKVLLTVKWGHTRREVAQNALSLLGSHEKNPAHLISAVITEVSLKRHAAYRHGDAAEVLARQKITVRLVPPPPRTLPAPSSHSESESHDSVSPTCSSRPAAS